VQCAETLSSRIKNACAGLIDVAGMEGVCVQDRVVRAGNSPDSTNPLPWLKAVS
jgi:hypothetical protein